MVEWSGHRISDAYKSVVTGLEVTKVSEKNYPKKVPCNINGYKMITYEAYSLQYCAMKQKCPACE